MALAKYKFVVKETEIKEVVDKQIVDMRVVNIGVKDEETDIIYPHPLTDFIRIMYEYMGTSVNSQIAPANVVCRFLNYLLIKIDEKDEGFNELVFNGLRGLKLRHGSRYITYLTMKGLSKGTVSNYENYLKYFYYYLQEQGLLTLEFQIKKYINAEDKLILESPFRAPAFETRLPSKNTAKQRKHKLKDFGDKRYRLVTDFIQKAREVAPEIAFGVCLQFYGGLRRGELVNLTLGSLKAVIGESLIVEIRDNRHILFPHLQDTTKEYPKRLNYLQTHLANQTILDNELLWEVYSQHMKTLELKLKRKEIKNPSALFLDQDGKAMSGNVYERKFKRVKKALMLELKDAEGRSADYALLSETSWGTHIGRGIFTNFLFDMGLTVTQIAIARGDTNIHSAMEYVDSKATTKALEEAIEEIKNIPAERFGFIERDIIRRKWKREATEIE